MTEEAHRAARITAGSPVTETMTTDTRRGEMRGKPDLMTRTMIPTLANRDIVETNPRKMYDEREIKVELQKPLAPGSTLRLQWIRGHRLVKDYIPGDGGSKATSRMRKGKQCRRMAGIRAKGPRGCCSTRTCTIRSSSRRRLRYPLEAGAMRPGTLKRPAGMGILTAARRPSAQQFPRNLMRIGQEVNTLRAS